MQIGATNAGAELDAAGVAMVLGTALAVAMAGGGGTLPLDAETEGVDAAVSTELVAGGPSLPEPAAAHEAHARPTVR